MYVSVCGGGGAQLEQILLNLTGDLSSNPARQIDAGNRGTCSDSRRGGEKRAKSSYFLVFLHFYLFDPYGSRMACQAKEPVRCSGRVRKRQRGWFVIVCLTVSACGPFTCGHRKANTISISACHMQYNSPYVSAFFLNSRTQEKAKAVVDTFFIRPQGGTGATKNTPPPKLSCSCSDEPRDVSLADDCESPVPWPQVWIT